MKSIEEENQGILKEFFIPKYLQYIKERVQVRTAPHASIGLVGREMVQRCSGDALEMFRRGSEVTCDRLRRSSNWNSSGAIGSLIGAQSVQIEFRVYLRLQFIFSLVSYSNEIHLCNIKLLFEQLCTPSRRFQN